MPNMTPEQELILLRNQVDELKKELSTCRQAVGRGEPERTMAFLSAVKKRLLPYTNRSWCMVHIDIERFKLFNEWYGREEGDRLIGHIETRLLQKAVGYGGVGAHLTADAFAMLLPSGCCTPQELEKEVESWVEGFAQWDHFLPAIGIYRISDPLVPVSTMCDRAALAADSVKGNYTRRLAFYDEGMGRALAEEQTLLPEFKHALDCQEFVLYVQPKCNMRTGKIVGCEMLVRWMHPEKGLLSPGDFIPMLEHNKLILDLDVYVWEETCRLMRRWMDAGNRAVAASVNVSRTDIYELDLCKILTGLIQKYDIDPALLELEITESAYTKDTDQILGVVESLRSKGFTVLMDDFGSGYSSLNMLKEIDVDILKLDLRFLRMDAKTKQRGSNILESVVQMAKWMDLRVIAEGVETQEQVDFLLCIGCEYGQGYYFYRPMTTGDFELEISCPDRVDYRGIVQGFRQEFRLAELFADNMVSEAFLNNLLGGVAIYDYCEGRLILVQVNDGYYRATGCNPIDLERKKDSIGDQVYAQDWETVLAGLREAEQHPVLGSEIEFRRYRLSGELMWMRLRLFFLGEQKGHKRFYASVSDVTRRREAENRLQDSQQQLRAVLGVSGEADPFRQMTEENRRNAAFVFAQIAPTGMVGGYCEPGFPFYFANDETIRLLGYSSREEFLQRTDGLISNTIHPDDMPQVMKDIGPTFYEGQEYITRYRMLRSDQSWFWVLDRGRVVRAEDGRLAIVSAFIDETDRVMLEKRMNLVIGGIPGDLSEVWLEKGVLRCRLYGEGLAQLLGYPREEYCEAVGGKSGIRMIHPDDYTPLITAIRTGLETGEPVNVDYRMLSSSGESVWINFAARPMTREDGGISCLGVTTDVSALKDSERSLALSEKRRRFVMRQAGLIMWEYEIAADVMRIFTADQDSVLVRLGFPEEYPGFFYGPTAYRTNNAAAQKMLYQIQSLAKRGGETLRTEFKVSLPGEEAAWIEVMGDAVFEEGGLRRLIGSVRDITGRRRVEEQLRESQKQLSTVAGIHQAEAPLEQMGRDNRTSAVAAFAGMIPAGMLGFYREDGYPIYFANEELVHMAGDERYEALTNRLDGRAVGLIHPGDREKTAEALGRITAEGEEYHLRYRLIRKDGGWNWVLEAGRALRDESGRLAFVCTCVDISERVALEQNYERFLHNAPCDMFRVRNGKYEFLSTNLAPVLGYSQEEYATLLQSSNGSRMTYPEDKPLVWEAAKRALENKEDIRVSFRTICKDKSVKRLSMQATRGEDEQGELCYYGVFTDISDLFEARQQLVASEKRLKTALRQAGLDVWEYNPAARRLQIFSVEGRSSRCGLPHNAVVERFPEQLIESGWFAPESRQVILDFIEACTKGTNGISADIHVIPPDGKELWLRLTGDGVAADSGFSYAIGSVRDITEVRRRELSNLENSKFLEALSGELELDWRINLTQNGPIGTTAGLDWMERVGVTGETDYGRAVIRASMSQVEPEYRGAFLEFLDRERLLTAFGQGITTDTLVYRSTHPRRARWAKVVYHLVQLDGSKDVYAYIYVLDIDEEKQREQALLRQAERDSLTGLYNRQTASRLIEEEIRELRRQEKTGALFMLDLDNFKKVNDCYGHIYGDAVLSENAAKLREFFRDRDIVCRLGGDEFMVFCGSITREDAAKRAEALCGKIERSYTSGGHKILLTSSIGIAMMPEHGRAFSDLYDRADVALYRAKSRGKNTCCIFDEEMQRVHPQSVSGNDETTMRKEFSCNVAEYVFKMLYESSDPDRALRSALELTAAHFKTQRACFAILRNGEQKFQASYCWSEEECPAHEEQWERLFCEHRGEIDSLFGREMLVCVTDPSLLPRECARFARQAGICALAACRLEMDEWGAGYLCFANYGEDKALRLIEQDEEQVKTLGEIICVFAQRLLEEKHRKQEAEMMGALLNRQDAGVYVVTRDLRLVYVNQFTKDFCPQVEYGQFCYHCLLGLDRPCADCLLNDLWESGKPVSIVKRPPIESAVLSRLSAGWIDWPGEGPCAVITVVALEDLTGQKP